MKRALLLIAVLTAILLVVLIWLDEAPAYHLEPVSFSHGQNRLEAVFVRPKEKGFYPCIIMVHGDGPADHSTGYDVFFEQFTKAGWCVLSWSKPGIGNSTGDWLTQTMSDRAGEVLAALSYLQSRADVRGNRIGLFGYSQAGWVMPLAASRSDQVAFVISVSGAIDVGRQSRFYHKNLAELKGYSREQTQRHLDFLKKSGRYAPQTSSYEAYLKFHRENAPQGHGPPLSERRWIFSGWLGGVNARKALRNTFCPVLAIWGDKDVYVDVEESFETYRQIFALTGNEDVTLKIFRNADHNLLRASRKRLVHKGPSSWWASLKYIVLGKDAFADGYFELLTAWLQKHK